MNTLVWIAQVLLAASLLWGAAMKLLMPVDKLSVMWPWVGQIPLIYMKITALIDLLGAAGIILPSILRIWPGLTSMAAVGIFILMVCASIFHISRGEASLIIPNIVFALLALFIAWGRYRKYVILTR